MCHQGKAPGDSFDCRLGILDESELDTVREVSPTSNPQIQSPFQKEPVEQEKPEPPSEPEKVESRAGDYVIKFGKRQGRKLSDFPNAEHMGMLAWIDNNYYLANKPIGKEMEEYYNMAKAYLKLATEDQIPF